jgi:hypothetical protein
MTAISIAGVKIIAAEERVILKVEGINEGSKSLKIIPTYNIPRERGIAKWRICATGLV